jgi:putative transposase
LCRVKAFAAVNQVVGVDVGLAHFATLSDGSPIENPRFFRKDEQALAAVHRL